MDSDIGPENENEASARRIREAQELLDKPKVDALKAELLALKESLDPRSVHGKDSFIRQFEDMLVRAKNFAEAIFPPKPLP